MASKTLELLIKVTDEASKQLEEIKGSTAGDGKGIAGVGDAMLMAAGNIAIAGLAIQKMAGYVSDGVDEYTDYVLGVDALSSAFGLTVEEGEQVMLMAEAFNVSNDALFSSLNKLAREGMGTGIEALQNLRKEFTAIEDPAERATYLFGIAGEQGQKVLAPMLEMSELEWSALIDGMDALAKVDEDMVANARELELASQGTSQAWANLKLEMMNFAAPGLSKLLEQMLAVMQGDIAGSGGAGAFGADSTRSLYSRGQGGLNFNSPGPASTDRHDTDRLLMETLRDLPGQIKDAVERTS